MLIPLYILLCLNLIMIGLTFSHTSCLSLNDDLLDLLNCAAWEFPSLRHSEIMNCDGHAEGHDKWKIIQQVLEV